MSLQVVLRELVAVQVMLTAPHGWGLHRMAVGIRLRPDGFSPEMQADHAATLARAIRTRSALQRLLPRVAPNDPEEAGAA